MTDTINISRELLEELRDAANECANSSARQHRIDFFSKLTADADALLAQPSEPQGGEEVDVVAHMHKGGLMRLRDTRREDWSPAWNRPRKGREPLMTVAQHRRLMAEQLERERGVVEALISCNETALKRGDKYLCDAIDNQGEPYQSQHLANTIAAWEKNHGK